MSQAMLPRGADLNYGYGDQENDQNSPSDPTYDQENYPPGGYHPMAAFLLMSSVLASTLNPMAAATRSGRIQKNGAIEQAAQERSTAQQNICINDEYQQAQQPAVRPSATPQIQKQAPPVSNQDLSQSLNQTSFVPTTGKSVLPNQVDQTIYEYPDGDPVLQAPAIKVTKNQVWELRFNIRGIMGMDITLPLGQLLNKSPQLCQDMAYNLQSSAPRYRVKKSTKAVPVAALAVPNRSNEVTAPTVTSLALPDNGEAIPMFCTSWLGELKAGRALINTGSIVNIMNGPSTSDDEEDDTIDLPNQTGAYGL
ncbi:hypothetical protein LPUS_10330 [Lasallia pustulata]|uniref:Uncharacterized protein n=1 Tax=Lasallia pustulata TaxID=136370 RepID=A0A1W5D9B1_9LECA|nr:hypothetical protein LPUS_10330 [Lasallia pustulata]